jgi:hypothetical protein
MSFLEMATLQEKTICVLWFFGEKSDINTHRRFRTQYGKKKEIHLQLKLSIVS